MADKRCLEEAPDVPSEQFRPLSAYHSAAQSPAMELPSSRELELELLIRQRDVQLNELTDELSSLKQYLSKQPGPSTTESVSLPPALLSVLLPHFNGAATGSVSGSNTVTAAITQRARVLQEENDELYNMLKQSETGKLKDEVRGLRRVVTKLEGALKESHSMIKSLSTELDKTYEALMNSSRQNNNTNNTKSSSHSPRSSYHPPLNSESAGNGTSASKLPPTGPRAQAQAAPRVHKRPRLSEAQMSPPPRPNMHLPLRSHDNASPRLQGRDLSRHSLDARGKSNAKMEVDGEHRAPSPINRDRERNREREKTRGERERERERAPKERERDRGREWDRDGNKNTGPRRNGTLSGISVRGAGGGGPGRKVNDRNIPNSHNHVADHASRTLQERLGL